ncbi:MAG TPA: ATP-binding protein [Sarcina sp.]|uniref:ATP-binding protein n=1 Tax=Sarcina sp. DSM 11001 TaxID=1798184 RepID=UPI00088826CA|nr:ATP-binding protein [Sarcina sp. DSM 11001]MBQ4247685.1 ATP-binding protein [Ruminococcus sp.]SDL91912.1 Anti-sigma regulatory factor (Ser/Thr protein kinase) [Sarcina sp. DSM 11001]HAL58981.1 ATP-binding protein [Sarcina sp.]
MKELTVEAKIDNIGIVTDFLDEALDAINCPMKAHMQIAVALDELFTNIAHYSYAPSTGNATIRVEPDKDNTSVTITLIDSGIPFNPLSRKEPDTTLPAEAREIGGLGIFLVRKTMDDLSYEYINNQNVVRIKKVLHPKK